MKKRYFLGFLVFLLLMVACKKQEGVGGTCSIQGKVRAKFYNSTFSLLINESDYPDTYVYIVYGDEINYGQRIKTNYMGEFEFKYLYKGDYTIYTYSLDSAAIVNGAINPVDSAVVQKVSLTKANQVLELEDFVVFR